MKKIKKLNDKYFWGPNITKNKNCGRAVIFKELIMVARMSTMDYAYLLNAFATKNKFNKKDVFSNALRLYFKYDFNINGYVFHPARKIDKISFEKNIKFYAKLLKNNIP